MNNITNHDIGVLIFQVLGVIICCTLLYVYIEYRINLARERKAEKAKSSVVMENRTDIYDKPASMLENEGIESLLNKGFCLALDVGVVSKFPQLMQTNLDDTILITDEILSAQKKEKVVDLHRYSPNSDTYKPAKKLPVNESFVARVGLDPTNITDRAIGTYLYTENTDLINIVFLTLNQEAQERAKRVGLKSELV